AGRQERDRAGGGRHLPVHPLVPQVQFLRRAGKEEEPVVGKGRQVELKGGRCTAVSRLQADPPQLITRRGRLVREDLEPVQGPHRVAASQFFRSHHPRLPGECSRWRRLFVRGSDWPATRRGTRGRVREHLVLNCRTPCSRTSTLRRGERPAKRARLVIVVSQSSAK